MKCMNIVLLRGIVNIEKSTSSVNWAEPLSLDQSETMVKPPQHGDTETTRRYQPYDLPHSQSEAQSAGGRHHARNYSVKRNANKIIIQAVSGLSNYVLRQRIPYPKKNIGTE